MRTIGYHCGVIHRLYVNNFKTLQNFDLSIRDLSTLLLIGGNGSGKSSIRQSIEVLQRVARGVARIGQLVKPKDFSFARSGAPMRFELEVQIGADLFDFRLAFELPAGFHELRVREESLKVNGVVLYERELAQVRLRKNDPRQAGREEASFLIDWHTVALPLIQQSKGEPLAVFREWLARSIVLAPIPSRIGGESRSETLEPSTSAEDFAAWFSGVVAHAPKAYTAIHEYLREVMPDFEDVRNPSSGSDSRSLSIRFAKEREIFTVPFDDLSDGEKCFLICALVLAANEAYGPLLCFWDEPDSHLSLSEVRKFVMTLRKGFQDGGQWIATSHNPETIRAFSDENTFVLSRESHLEPTLSRPLAELGIHGDLIHAAIRGEL